MIYAKFTLRAQALISGMVVGGGALIQDSAETSQYEAKSRENGKPSTTVMSCFSNSLGTTPLKICSINLKATNSWKFISASLYPVASQDAVKLLKI